MSSPKHAVYGKATEMPIAPADPALTTSIDKMLGHSAVTDSSYIETSAKRLGATSDSGMFGVVLRLLLTVFGGLVVLALLFGDGMTAKLGIIGILVGFTVSALIIYDAQNGKRSVSYKVLLHCAGFLLLAEVVWLINRLLAYG